MNRWWLVALGALATVLASVTGLVLVPQHQLESLQPVRGEGGLSYPVEPFGSVAAGRDVYRDLGCLYCHSQQVRPAFFGADIDRGWGRRRSVSRDILFAHPPLLGTMRTGPDLANIGVRQPSREWHHRHLYDPESMTPGTIMPAFPFLYHVAEQPAPADGDAIRLPGTPTRYLVPTDRARALVDYLRSLDQSTPLPEAQ